jgi:hypothetical protein
MDSRAMELLPRHRLSVPPDHLLEVSMPADPKPANLAVLAISQHAIIVVDAGRPYALALVHFLNVQAWMEGIALKSPISPISLLLDLDRQRVEELPELAHGV